MRDIRKLKFKYLDLFCEFHEMYAKLKGFGVREQSACKSRTDGHPTFKILKCFAEGFRLQNYPKNRDRKKKPKELIPFDCLGEIRFKWIKDADNWIVTKFMARHTHSHAKRK